MGRLCRRGCSSVAEGAGLQEADTGQIGDAGGQGDARVDVGQLDLEFGDQPAGRLLARRQGRD